jgi:hypothetical protein
VTYRDGAKAVIRGGARYAATYKGAPYALVGSSLSNGDRIIETLWEELNVGVLIEEGKQIEGLFDAGWVAPPCEPLHRFVVQGATTPKGGIVREVSSDWAVAPQRRRRRRFC